ncbi:hypothetical protein G7054_g2989 [Neopestalotiopsis clavispora]|nr:hypothetical protein G7054_g2989 [Neopestalotiopsis clavispora]
MGVIHDIANAVVYNANAANSLRPGFRLVSAELHPNWGRPNPYPGFNGWFLAGDEFTAPVVAPGAVDPFSQHDRRSAAPEYHYGDVEGPVAASPAPGGAVLAISVFFILVVFTSGLFAVLTRTTTRDGSQVACLASHSPELYQHGTHPLSSHADEKKFDVSIAAGRIDFLPHPDILRALALGCVVFHRPGRGGQRRVCKLVALASQLFNDTDLIPQFATIEEERTCLKMYRISKSQKYQLESRGLTVGEEATLSDVVARARQRAIDINDVALVRDLGLIEGVLELEGDDDADVAPAGAAPAAAAPADDPAPAPADAPAASPAASPVAPVAPAVPAALANPADSLAPIASANGITGTRAARKPLVPCAGCEGRVGSSRPSAPGQPPPQGKQAASLIGRHLLERHNGGNGIGLCGWRQCKGPSADERDSDFLLHLRMHNYELTLE